MYVCIYIYIFLVCISIYIHMLVQLGTPSNRSELLSVQMGLLLLLLVLLVLPLESIIRAMITSDYLYCCYCHHEL